MSIQKFKQRFNAEVMATEFVAHDMNEWLSPTSFAQDHFDSGGGPLKLVITNKSNGTLSMIKLWRMWMADIAKFQAERGATIPITVPATGVDGEIKQKVIGSRPFNAKDAHEAYTVLCLGSDELGNRLSWAVNSDEYQGRKVASIGQKLHAMQKFHQFCMEHSIPIRVPEQSEYNNLMEGQNGQ